MKKKTKILIDVERIKHSYTGLNAYCTNLAVNLDKYFSNLYDFYFFSYPRVDLPKHLKQVVGAITDKFYFNNKNKYDVVHGTWQGTKYIPKDDSKFVLTIHDLNFLYTDKPKRKKKKLLQDVQKRIDRANAVTVISNYVKKDVEKHLDLRGKPLEVIYNGVELVEFPDFDTPKYKPKQKFLFTVGTVLYKKHFHVLPRVLVNTDYELVIAGIQSDNSYVKLIEAEANKYNVRDRVHLIGSISEEEKYWYVNHCEAFLFPSISEGFGLPPIEAMILGKPVFLSTFTSLPEVGGDVAYYFNSFEAVAMQKVLKDGLTDYHTNKKNQAIVDWASQFTWESATKAYVAVYNLVLDIQDDKLEETIFVSKDGKQKITAIIPAYNEAVNINEAIQSVSFADEVLIIDSFSTDNTVALAKDTGARVIQRKFDDFSSQKNYAISQAKYNWIFVLDADERLSDELKNEIGIVLDNPSKDAYSIRRENYFAGKRIKFSGWQTDKVIRLFNRNKSKYNGKTVHEEIETTGELGFLTNKLQHYTYRDYTHYFQKINHYAELKAIELHNQGKKATVFHFVFPPLFRFISHYFIRLGFLDGFPGFMIARIQSYGVFIRYNRLWLKNRKLD